VATAQLASAELQAELVPSRRWFVDDFGLRTDSLDHLSLRIAVAGSEGYLTLLGHEVPSPQPSRLGVRTRLISAKPAAEQRALHNSAANEGVAQARRLSQRDSDSPRDDPPSRRAHGRRSPKQAAMAITLV
jgi:hypothetical protein